MRGIAEGTPIVPQGLPYNPTISLSLRTAGPIAEILFSVLLLFLEGLGSKTIRWGREMGRKTRIAAAWECERLEPLFEGRIDCSLSAYACLSGFTQFFAYPFGWKLSCFAAFFCFLLVGGRLAGYNFRRRGRGCACAERPLCGKAFPQSCAAIVLSIGSNCRGQRVSGRQDARNLAWPGAHASAALSRSP